MVSITMGQRVAGFFSSALLVAVVLSAADAFHQPGLKLVQVVFRHADRAPDPIEMFPSDPHYNDTFFPEGLGGMTNIGKRREYQLGRILREKYHNFLGELYLPETLVARSTDYKRTKMCLQLVLAALFPPRASQRWNNNLNWQPIPTNYATSKDDWLMIPEECPEYLKERKIAEKTPEYVEKVESMREFMNNLTVFTGKNISTPNDMYNLYHILVAESSKGIKLPEWTNGIFPDGKLLDGINLEYEIFSYTKNMRRLNGGKLLHDMIEHMQEKKNGLGEKDRKVYLYSGHETNIAAILQVLGVYEPHVPAYSSAVMVEFYEFRGKFYVKVDYYYGIPARTETLQIPGCDLFCPFDKFLEVLSEVTPSSDELVCDKSVKPEEIEKTYNAVQQ